MSILCFLSIHSFVCLFVATELSQTVATSRRDLLSAIVFVAEHPINHNFPFMINQIQSITVFYRSPFMVSQFTFEVKDIFLNNFFKIPNKINFALLLQLKICIELPLQEMLGRLFIQKPPPVRD